MREPFVPGTIVQHFKRENVADKTSNKYLYEIIGTARHTESGEEFMIYKPLYDSECIRGVNFAARPLAMFMSEVDHEKYPDIKQKYRFEEKTGHWIEKEIEDTIRWKECSECHSEYPNMNGLKYCPNCGVKMKGYNK